MLVNFGLSEAHHLGVLSSRVHLEWAQATGALLEDRPRYTKSACFDPFPFPEATAHLRESIGETAEELDDTRRKVQAEHPHITLTGLYNAMAAHRCGAVVDHLFQQRERILILAELHARLDALVEQAYGWPTAGSSSEMLQRLFELNISRQRDEQAGRVLWLRGDYQRPLFSDAVVKTDPKASSPIVQDSAFRASKRAFPRQPEDQSEAVWEMLSTSGGPMSLADVICSFRSGRKTLQLDIQATLIALAQYGHLGVLPDGRFQVRRAA